VREGESIRLSGRHSAEFVIRTLVLAPALRARIELLRDRAHTGLTVTCGGVSMQPSISRGDAVTIRSGQPRRGDVAAFVTQRGELEMHRLIARAPGLDWWVHAGDNQAAPDLGLVHREQFVGIVPGHRRRPGPIVAVRAALRIGRAAVRSLRYPR
jgi:hypothetical protein